MDRRTYRPNSPYPHYLNPYIQSNNDDYRNSSPDFENDINQSSYELEDHPDRYVQYRDVNQDEEVDVDHDKEQDFDHDHDYHKQTFEQNHYHYRTPSQSDDEDQGPYYDSTAAEHRDDKDMYPHNVYVDREDRSSDEEQNSYDYYVDQTQQFAAEHDDIDHQFQRLEINDERPEHDTFSPCNTPNEESHFAYKDVFYHEDAGQHFHIDCQECIDYMNQSGFRIPPKGYDYEQHGQEHYDDDDYDDKSNNFY